MSKQKNILHLADLCFDNQQPDTGIDKEEDHRFTTRLANYLATLRGETSIDLVVVSGDLARHGLAADYRLAAGWLRAHLIEPFSLQPEQFVFCPGDRDLNQDKVVGMIAPGHCQEADEWLQATHLVNFSPPFFAYEQFCRNFGVPAYQFGTTTSYLLGSRFVEGIRFVALNSAWFARDPQADQGKMWVGYPLLMQMCRDGQLGEANEQATGPLTITLLHHTPAWLDEGEARVYHHLTQYSHLILTASDPESVPRPAGESQDCYQFCVGQSETESKTVGSGALLRVTLAPRQLQHHLFEFDAQRQAWHPSVCTDYFLEEDNDEQVFQGGALKGRGDLSLYYQALEAWAAILPVVGDWRINGTAPRLSHFYVPRTARIRLGEQPSLVQNYISPRQEQTLALRLCLQKAEQRGYRGLFLLGDPGAGKTAFLQGVVLQCLRSGTNPFGLESKMVPLFFNLGEWRNPQEPITAFFQRQLVATDPRIKAKFGEKLLARRDLLFLLDGWGRLTTSEQQIALLAFIARSGETRSTHRFIISSRFAEGEKYPPELPTLLLVAELQPFNEDETARFVYHYYQFAWNVAEKAANAEKSSQSAGQLVKYLQAPAHRDYKTFTLTRNPLLLGHICMLNLHQDRVPGSRVRLYEEVIGVELEGWQRNQSLGADISAREARRILQTVALGLHIKVGRTRATVTELARRMQPILQALGFHTFTPRDFLTSIQEETGLLRTQAGTYEFRHLGFQEYLAARELRSKAFREPMVIAEMAAQFGNPWWREVILMLLGLDDPSLFEPFFNELGKKDTFATHRALLDACLDEAAEVSPEPFAKIAISNEGEASSLQQRRLAALRLLERLAPAQVKRVISHLPPRNSGGLEKWLTERFARSTHETMVEPTSGYELVKIAPGRYMGRYPVTNLEYGRFLKANPKVRVPAFWGNRHYNHAWQPVIGITWYEAKAYATWANLRLPSELEWVYSCWGDSTTLYHGGNMEDDLNRVGWYALNAGGYLHPIGDKEPNAFGLYDLHGNVWEWLEDMCQAATSLQDQVTDPSAVIRGGAWNSPASGCQATTQGCFPRKQFDDCIGFRLCRSD